MFLCCRRAFSHLTRPMGFPLGRIAAVGRFHPWPSPAGLHGKVALNQTLNKKVNKKGAHWTPTQK
jgi:hypothetical protein